MGLIDGHLSLVSVGLFHTRQCDHIYVSTAEPYKPLPTQYIYMYCSKFAAAEQYALVHADAAMSTNRAVMYRLAVSHAYTCS